MFLNDIGNELSSLRKRENKTLDELSKFVGIHKNTLCKYESDSSNLSLENLDKILSFYNIDEFIFFKNISDYNHNKKLNIKEINEKESV